MSDRKIDAIGKTDATAWNPVQSQKGSSNLVRVISGVLSHTRAGEVMHSMVQNAGNGAFKISLNGESFLIKGLPSSLAGKEVSFITHKSVTNPNGKAELFWIGAKQTGSLKNLATPDHKQQGLAQNRYQHANILSPFTASLKPGQTLLGHIDAIQGKQMNISVMIPNGKEANQNSRHHMLTTAVDGLKQGQQITVKVLSGANNKPMLEIMARQNMNLPGIKPDSSPHTMASFKLAAGDIATAFVQQRLSNGHVQLNIQGTTVETPAPATVNKGDMLMLKMIKQPADFQLLSVQKKATEKALANLKSTLPISNSPITQNIAAMRNILPTLPAADLPQVNGLQLLETALKSSELTPQQPLNGERLGKMIHNAGTGLESKLLQLPQNPSLSPSLQHDLKSIMLQLATNPQADDLQQNRGIKALAELGQQSVARIETTQALNVLAHMQGEPIRVELPMLVNQQMVNVQLSMQQNESYESNNAQEQGDSNQSYNVLFALELSQLGNIRVDANISDTTVHARIYNDNSDSNHFLLDHMQRLQTRLQDLGFKEVYLLTSQQQPEAEKQQRFEQLKQMTPTSLHLLDIRI